MEKKWTAVLEPKSKLLDLHLKEVWQYRDLIFLFIKRDFTTKYKQTILGPIWFIVQPLFTTLIQTFVFGNIAHLSTDGLPQFLFYMAGNVPWLYFSTCLTSTSSTFTANAGIFGKVYFPRLTTPIASVISSMLNFVIQFSLFLGFSLFFLINGADITVMEMPPVDASSTEIRDLAKAGKSISGLVPPGVEEYIIEHKLYR